MSRPAPIAIIRAAFGRGEWPTLSGDSLRALHRHGLAGFVYASLSRQDRLGALAPNLREQLRAAVMANLHAEQTRAPTLAEVLACLSSPPAIPTLGFKGIDYAHRVYADPSERPMGDHDLIVPAARFDEAVARLFERGFRSALKQSGVAALDGHYAAQLVRDGYHLDLHRSVRQSVRAAIDYDAMFARSIAGELRGRSLAWLDPRDALLLHVYHQAAHEFAVPLITFVDLELLLQRTPRDRSLLDRASVFGIAGSLAHALQLRDALFGFVSPIPARRGLPTIEEIAAGEPPSRSLQLLRKALLFDSPARLARFVRYSAGALFR